jgi:hypothetical protein
MHFKHGRAMLFSSYSPDGKWITVPLDGVGGRREPAQLAGAGAEVPRCGASTRAD